MKHKKLNLDDCTCQLQLSGLFGYNIRKSLRRNGILTIRQLITKDKDAVAHLKGMGSSYALYLETALKDQGLSFDMSEEAILRYEEKS